ncbi:hypothetical protein DWB84_05075 [Saccharophagus sp. K07]|uniref:chemotaxis protein CheW n=1 Tax=Saccharophagus sp. K07 TaxID=2283636 RepID=UPI001651E131|nr:hypothetical protein [Saccharophagus sp. K07]
MEIRHPGANGGAPDERWELAEYALSFTTDRPAASASVAARCYGFTISDQHFLLAEGQAAELISQPVFTPMPNTPEHCLGLANVRGNIVPYYTIRIFLNSALDQVQESHRYALLVGDAINGVLLALDAKPTAVLRDSLQRNPQPSSKLGEFPQTLIKGYFVAQEREWVMLDTQKLMQFLASAELSRERNI